MNGWQKLNRRLMGLRLENARLRGKLKRQKELALYPEQLDGIENLCEFVFPGDAIFARRPIIYFLVEKGVVVYVGQSIAGPIRALSHATEIQCCAKGERRRKTFDSIWYFPMDGATKNELDREERRWINEFLPVHNRDSGTMKLRKRERALDTLSAI
jgi:hypothetical protein